MNTIFLIAGIIIGFGIRPMWYVITGKDIPLLKEDDPNEAKE